eukprot:1159286-Pelagomonas_calceolata.AAC.7
MEPGATVSSADAKENTAQQVGGLMHYMPLIVLPTHRKHSLCAAELVAPLVVAPVLMAARDAALPGDQMHRTEGGLAKCMQVKLHHAQEHAECPALRGSFVECAAAGCQGRRVSRVCGSELLAGACRSRGCLDCSGLLSSLLLRLCVSRKEEHA